MQPNGSVFYKDQYEQQYKVDWTTNNDILDITTVVFQPYVWGLEPQGYVKAHTIYRKGLVLVKRQVFKIIPNGYIIQAEGTSEYIDFIQMTYPCGGGPEDNFKSYLNKYCSDDFRIGIIEGSHWVDIDSLDDTGCVWGDLNNDGTFMDLTETGGINQFEWIDVW